MAMETYTLEVEEADNGEGITADVYNIDGEIEESVWVDYADHGLTPNRTGDDRPEPKNDKATADVMALDLQVERIDGGFEFRLLGDNETLVTERVEDGDWGLAPAGE